jgi:hypothetical protein
MDAWLPAVVQDVLVRAAGVFQSVGQDGHAVEGAVGVNRLGDGGDGGGQPGALEGDGTEGVSGNVNNEATDHFVSLLYELLFENPVC